MSKIFLVLSIDTECDKGLGWKTQFPLKFRSVIDGIPNILMPLFRQFGIKPTFLLSPEVIQDLESVRILNTIQDAELGTHLHGEFIQPLDEPDSPVTSRAQFSYPEEVESEKLYNLTELFRKTFDRSPLSFRAGRFALGLRSLTFLSKFGYKVDSSVTPFRTHNFDNGLKSNYWGAPIYPYFPHKNDPRRVGNLPILEVPVTTIIPSLLRYPLWFVRLLDENHRWDKKFKLVRNNASSLFWLRPFRASSSEMINKTVWLINNWPYKKHLVLNIMFHSVEIIPGASPYAQTFNDVDYLVESLTKFFKHLFVQYHIKSIGLSDLYDVIKGENVR